MKISSRSQLANRNRAKLIVAAINIAICGSAHAAITCTPQGSEILLDQLPTDEIMKSLELRPAKSKIGDEGKFRLMQKDGRLLQVTTDGERKCAISFSASEIAVRPIGAAESQPTLAATSTATPAAPGGQASGSATLATPTKPPGILDNKAILATYSEDLAVPSSPAFTLLGVDPVQASLPRTPKDIAAQLVQGRGADGKIKAGVAIDTTAFQLLRIVGLTTAENSAQEQEIASRKRLEKSAQKNDQRTMVNRFFNEDADEVDNSHTFLNRLKVSIATTEDQDASPVTKQNAADLAFGLHYVFRDDAEMLTSSCNKENSKNPATIEAINAALDTKALPRLSPTNIPGDLKRLLAKKYDEKLYVGLSKEQQTQATIEFATLIHPLVLKACSLTDIEKLEAKSFMAGFGHSYRLEDGSWGNRQSGTTGYWLTYAFKGTKLPNAKGVFQPIVHIRSFRNQRIADPADSANFIRKDTNLLAVRLRLGVPTGAASIEFSQARNKLNGQRETVKRYALALQYKVADNIWLVASSGRETTSNGATRSSPFVLTNLRFGGNQSP
jgi:hypothetical protein